MWNISVTLTQKPSNMSPHQYLTKYILPFSQKRMKTTFSLREWSQTLLLYILEKMTENALKLTTYDLPTWVHSFSCGQLWPSTSLFFHNLPNIAESGTKCQSLLTCVAPEQLRKGRIGKTHCSPSIWAVSDTWKSWKSLLVKKIHHSLIAQWHTFYCVWRVSDTKK